MNESKFYQIERVLNDTTRLHDEAALLATVFSEPMRYTVEYLRWQYFNNPSGDIVGYDAYHDGEIAAHYVVMPLQANLLGQTLRGVLSLNTVTHPKHQGKGLFVRLASATYDLARELGYQFVIGVANANSTPGFVRKLSFQLVSPLVAELGVGPVEATEPGGDVDFEQLWSDDARRWRVANPAGRYRISGGHLYSATHIPMVQMQLSASKWQFHGTVPSEAVAGLLTAWIGLNPRRHRRGFAVPVPAKLRPSPLNFIFRDLTGSERRLAPDRVVVDAVDFDAY